LVAKVIRICAEGLLVHQHEAPGDDVVVRRLRRQRLGHRILIDVAFFHHGFLRVSNPAQRYDEQRSDPRVACWASAQQTTDRA
jgi:hypothetical protein